MLTKFKLLSNHVPMDLHMRATKPTRISGFGTCYQLGPPAGPQLPITFGHDLCALAEMFTQSAWIT